jgi:hypothetical protein
MSDWGKGVINNIGWGQGANNDIGWGSIYDKSNAGETLLSGGGFDSDYQAVLDFATSEGDTLPSANQQILQNNLLRALKTFGIWNKLDSFAMFATDGDVGFSLICWKRLVKMTAVNSPTFTANEGFTGNGTSSRINSGFTPDGSGNYKLNAASFGVFVKTQGTNNEYLAGARSNTRMRAVNSSLNRINSTSINGAFDFNVVGLSHLNKSSATNAQCIVNGVASNRTVTNENLGSDFVFLDFGEGNGPSDAQISLGFIGGDLSAEAAEFSTAVNTYISSI